MRVGLTVTSLLHEVDLVLGVNWLQLVNPVVDWSSGKVYLPNAVHTALLQGDRLKDHVKVGTVMVLVGEEQLKAMNESEDKNKIAVLKCPKFWKVARDATNSWTNSFEGRVSWGYLYKDKCELCNLKNECKDFCKHKARCKLYSIVNDKGEEVMKMKRVNKNAKLPVRGTSGAAGYDLAIAEAAVVPAHSKCLVKTGLAIALPPGCYGRIAPRSGLALKKFIDVGAAIIDANYRGEVGAILFNFGNEDFVVNMGDRITQLIFEKIKTPKIKEMDDLEGTDRGAGGYGSTGTNVVQDKNDTVSNSNLYRMNMDVKKDAKEKDILSQSRRLITATQMSKLAKGNNPIFLAIIRETNEAPRMKKSNKRSSAHAACFAAAHGMSEGTKRSINKKEGPRKDIISVAKREQQVLDSVPVCHWEKLGHLIQQYRDILPEHLPQGIPPKGWLSIR